VALLLGAITPHAARTPWHIPGRWRAALIAWALVTIAGATIVALREIDFTPALFDVTTISNTSRGGWPAFIIRFVLHTALVTIIGILWFDWLLTLPAHELTRAVAFPLAVGAVPLGLVAVYQLLVDLSFLNPTFYAHLSRATGTMLDANLSGTIAAVWIGGAFILAERGGRGMWLAAAAVATLGWLAVWASGSRTGFAAALIVTGSGVVGLYSAFSQTSRRRAIAVAAGAAIAVAAVLLLLATAPLAVVGPAARLAPAVSDVSVESLKGTLKENLWNRNGYGLASTAMIASHPWFGVGVGSFQSLLPEFIGMLDRQLPPDNAQNWYRHQVAELGLVGSLPILAWVFAFGAFVVRPGAAPSITLWGVRGVLVALAAISWVGMPGQEPAVAITFWTFAAWYVHLAGTPAAQRSPGPAAWAVIAAVVAVFSIGTAYAALTELRVPARAQRGGWPYSYGFSPPLRESGRPGGWTGQRAVAVVEAPARWMTLMVSIDPRRAVETDRQPDRHLPIRPSDVKVWCNGALVLERQLTTTAPESVQVALREGQRWVLIETWVSRLLPQETGAADDRERGLLVDWSFTAQPGAGPRARNEAAGPLQPVAPAAP
jgi:hypothetical protein